MLFFSYFHFFLGMLFLFMIFYIWRHTPNSLLRTLTLFIIFCHAVDSLAFMVIHNPLVSYRSAMTATTIVHISTSQSTLIFFAFALAFSGFFKNRLRFLILLIPVFLVALINLEQIRSGSLASLDMKGPAKHGWEIVMGDSPLLSLLMNFLLLLDGLSFVFIYRTGIRATSLQKKKQSRIILIASFLTVISFLLLFLLLRDAGSHLVLLMDVPSLIWAIGIVWAMSKERFLKPQPELASRSIFNALAEGLICLDMNGLISWINPEIQNLLKYESTELVGKPIRYIIAMDEESGEELSQRILKGLTSGEEIICVSSDGQCLHMRISSARMTSQLGEDIGAFCMLQDITRMKQYENDRKHLLDELDKAAKQIKTIERLVPICASCKKIRDDQGFWMQVEEFIKSHSDVRLTHGLCNDCLKKTHEEIDELQRKSPPNS